MNFEPGKFYIGVIDFFSVLLPGALLIYLIKDWAYTSFFGGSLADLHQTEQWILVGFASYLVGHFIFLLGSFLDDLIYDPLRNATYSRQIFQLAHGKKLKPAWVRRLAPRFFKPSMDRALKKALELRDLKLQPLHAADTINVFKWCKARLNLTSPTALASVERFEANSKFFRSLLVVLIFILPLSLLTKHWFATLAISLMILGSLWRYIDQRKKGVLQAYWSVIVQEADKTDIIERYTDAKDRRFTHGGGLVYKGEGKGKRYLLVRARSEEEEWVLPKGHIEPGENPAETAVREVLEETGVWAKVETPLGKVKFRFKGEKVKVQFYLLKFIRQGKAIEERAIKWATFEECLKLINFEETLELIRTQKET